MVGYCVFCTYKNANLSILNQGNQRRRSLRGKSCDGIVCFRPSPAYPSEIGLEAAETPTEEQVKKALCREIMEYAQEYYNQFEAYSQAPNRAGPGIGQEGDRCGRAPSETKTIKRDRAFS